MDFKELLSKAGSNAKKQNRKVIEADQEIEFEKRRNLERLAIQKRLEKENIKRKALLRPPSPKVFYLCFIINNFFFSLLSRKSKLKVKSIKIKLLFF